MKCTICGGNLIEFSSKYMDGCVLVCTKCNISSPYADTITLAELAFKAYAIEIKNRERVDFDQIDFGERRPNLDSHGKKDDKSLSNKPED